MLNLGIKLTELGLIPESILRIAIKKLLKQRLLEIPINPEQRASQKANFLEELQSSPIALSTELANEQHYEVPPAFFQQIMGAYLKYSCGWFEENTSSLDEAEANMLELYIKRLDIQNNQRILRFGLRLGKLHALCSCKVSTFNFCCSI
jgi:cyclopropane-fatty-acyl-phospholipid synthase